MDIAQLIEKYINNIDEGAGNLGILPKEWLAPLTAVIYGGGGLAGENSEIKEIGKFTVKPGKEEEAWRTVRSLTNKTLKEKVSGLSTAVAGFYFTEDNQPLYLLIVQSGGSSTVNLDYSIYYNDGAIEKREKLINRGSGRRSWSSKQSSDKLTIEDIKDTFTADKAYRVYVITKDIERINKRNSRIDSKNTPDSLTTLEKDSFKKLVRNKLETKVDKYKTSIVLQTNEIIADVMSIITSTLNGEKVDYSKKSEIKKRIKKLSDDLLAISEISDNLEYVSMYYDDILQKDGERIAFTYYSKKILNDVDKL